MICIAATVTLAFAVALSYSYPLSYEREVTKASEEFGVEKALVYAVIRTESKFRPGAKSGAGAVGLMQLLPETAEWIAGKSGEEVGDLYDPEQNVRLGTAYLKYLLGKFSLSDALAAYNAGEGNVARWIESGVTEYPYAETRNYVKRVRRSLKVYRFRTR